MLYSFYVSYNLFLTINLRLLILSLFYTKINSNIKGWNYQHLIYSGSDSKAYRLFCPTFAPYTKHFQSSGASQCQVPQETYSGLTVEKDVGSPCGTPWFLSGATSHTSNDMARVASMTIFVVQLLSCVWFFATPWTTAYQASLSFTISQSLLKLMSIESVMPSNHFILWCLVLLLPSIFLSIRVFSNGSALHIRWPNIGASALASVLSMNIQGWFPLLLLLLSHFSRVQLCVTP